MVLNMDMPMTPKHLSLDWVLNPIAFPTSLLECLIGITNKYGLIKEGMNKYIYYINISKLESMCNITAPRVCPAWFIINLLSPFLSLISK